MYAFWDTGSRMRALEEKAQNTEVSEQESATGKLKKQVPKGSCVANNQMRGGRRKVPGQQWSWQINNGKLFWDVVTQYVGRLSDRYIEKSKWKGKNY